MVSLARSRLGGWDVLGRVYWEVVAVKYIAAIILVLSLSACYVAEPIGGGYGGGYGHYHHHWHRGW